MISYALLDSSTKFYVGRGFVQIEAPWTVTQSISDITRPEGAKDFKLIHDDNKVLVASGEQSFLYLAAKGFLPEGRYQTITPCFRKEAFGPFHTKYFMKNELIITGENLTEDIVDAAYAFFKSILPVRMHSSLSIVTATPTSYDIELDGVEIGSYGYRTCEFLDWTYGTGIAEPRFSNAVRALDKKMQGGVK